MNEPAHAASVPRTLRLKVRGEAYPWLNSAATEVDTAWNWANEVGAKAAQPYAGKPRSLYRVCEAEIEPATAAA